MDSIVNATMIPASRISASSANNMDRPPKILEPI